MCYIQGMQFDAPAPAPRHTPIAELAQSAQRLLNVFVANGYALKVLAATFLSRGVALLILILAEHHPSMQLFVVMMGLLHSHCGHRKDYSVTSLLHVCRPRFRM